MITQLITGNEMIPWDVLYRAVLQSPSAGIAKAAEVFRQGHAAPVGLLLAEWLEGEGQSNEAVEVLKEVGNELPAAWVHLIRIGAVSAREGGREIYRLAEDGVPLSGEEKAAALYAWKDFGGNGLPGWITSDDATCSALREIAGNPNLDPTLRWMLIDRLHFSDVRKPNLNVDEMCRIPGAITMEALQSLPVSALETLRNLTPSDAAYGALDKLFQENGGSFPKFENMVASLQSISHSIDVNRNTGEITWRKPAPYYGSVVVEYKDSRGEPQKAPWRLLHGMDPVERKKIPALAAGGSYRIVARVCQGGLDLGERDLMKGVI